MARFNKPATIDAKYSITGQQCQVTIIDYDSNDRLYLIRYKDGFEEWLPSAAFIAI